MPAELWTGIITGVVIPVLLKVLMHYMPWLADDPKLRDKATTGGRPPAETEDGS